LLNCREPDDRGETQVNIKKEIGLACAMALALGGLVFLLGLVTTAASADPPDSWYVAPSGADYPGCGAANDPCLTINYAISESNVGATVIISPGTYAENVVIAKSLSIQGAGVGSTVLQGAGSGFGVEIPYVGAPFDGITITNMTIRGYLDGVEILGRTSNLLIEDVEAISNTRHGIWSQALNPAGWTFRRVDASFNNAGGGSGRGIWIVNGVKQNITIEDGTFDYNGLVGIEIGDGNVTGLTVTGNTVIGNGDAGIAVLSATGPGVNLVSSNTVINNGRFGIEIRNSAGSGNASGPGSVVVSSNMVARNVGATDARDHGGIVLIRRYPVVPDNAAQPSGVLMISNTVSGYVRRSFGSTGDGFGIVVAGLSNTVKDNTVTGNNVGIQIQGGNPAINQQSTDYFDRDDAALGAAVLIHNSVAGNDVGLRVINSTLMANNNIISGSHDVGIVFTGNGPVTATLSGAFAHANTFRSNGPSGAAHVTVAVSNANPDLWAYYNDWDATTLTGIEDAIYHQPDDGSLAEVRYFDVRVTAMPTRTHHGHPVTVTATLVGLQHLSGHVISFTTSLGRLSAVTGTTGADGHASVVLASTVAGTATVTAAAGMEVHNIQTDTVDVLFARVHNLNTDEWFNTIQAAIDDVDTADGHTLLAHSGTYTEDLIITKGITLTGQGQDDTILYPATSVPTCTSSSPLCGYAATNMCIVQAENVTIHDLTLDGNNPALSSGVFVNSVEVDARNGIIGDYSVATPHDLTVYDVTVRNVYLRGIQATGSGPITGIDLHNNVVRNVAGDENESAAMMFSNATGTMVSNTVEDTVHGLSCSENSACLLEGNVVTNPERSGIHVSGNLVAPGGTTVLSNTVTGGWMGIAASYQEKPLAVAHNVVNGATIGVDVGGRSSNPLITHNQIDGSGLVTATGIVVETDGHGDVDWGTSATLQDNEIHHTGYGVALLSGPGLTVTALLEGNLISYTLSSGVLITGSGSLDVTVGDSLTAVNTFRGSNGYAIQLIDVNDNVLARFNDWGITRLDAIEAAIHHKADDPTLGEVIYYDIAIEAVPTTMFADGSSFATITGTLQYLYAPAGNIVSFTTSLGQLSTVTATADADGNARVTLSSATTGAATVKATAGMAGNNPATATITIEFVASLLDHFAFAPVGEQRVGVDFAITITAEDSGNGAVTSYNGFADLTDASGAIPPTSIGPFDDGLWTGRVSVTLVFVNDILTATHPVDPGISGSSNAFHVRPYQIYVPIVTRDYRSSTMGPLTVHPSNPRYFADGSGQAVYLTGAHTWCNFKDRGVTDPPAPFDYAAYLDFMQAHNHNFMRMWTWELAKYSYDGYGPIWYTYPFPWPRTGPSQALDGKPKFDLSQLNQEYFDRLRSRVIAARQRGIYVSIMLFEGHGIQRSDPPWRWDGHPFNVNNNINGIDGDPDRDGLGVEIHTLEIPAVTALQEAYVRKMIDAVNDLDNVLYEITNESGPYSTDWQYHMIDYVKSYEASKPNQHPVGMTFQYKGGENAALFSSRADWISPHASGSEPYRSDPPAADGSKVIILDTDHLWGIGGSQEWVWKSFVRGLNPIYMDPYGAAGEPPADESIRQSLGHTLTYANRMKLAAMTPRGSLASTGYCLANAVAKGAQYLVYLPSGGSVTVDLSASPGTLSVEWFNPSTGATLSAGTTTGGVRRSFRAPFHENAVLYIWDES
jgi:hypothetical protein